MATTAPLTRPQPTADLLSYARSILHAESAVLAEVATRLGSSFERVIDHLTACNGRIAVTGVGKSADIGQKIVGTFNSTGTRAYNLDATRAVHGDLGMVHPDDVAVVLSHSGESEELVRLLGPLGQLASSVIAITGNAHGTLARRADTAIIYGPLDEVCPLALAPSASTVAMLSIGDAIAFVLMAQRGFTAEDFARYHPAGTLGRKLATVDLFMRRQDDMRWAYDHATVREVFSTPTRGRRTGAVILIDDDGRLTGLFTDSDLARLFTRNLEGALDRPMSEVMTREPLTLPPNARLLDALELLRRHKVSELPIVDADHRPLGLLDITDVVGLSAVEQEGASPCPPVRLSA